MVFSDIPITIWMSEQQLLFIPPLRTHGCGESAICPMLEEEHSCNMDFATATRTGDISYLNIAY